MTKDLISIAKECPSLNITITAGELIEAVEYCVQAAKEDTKAQGNRTGTQLPEYISRHKVADMLKVSPVTISDWTAKGILTAYKIARKVYYKRDEVEQALIRKGGIHGK
jgi:hypothetical protein